MVHCPAHLLHTHSRARTVAQQRMHLPRMLAATLCVCLAPATFSLLASSDKPVHARSSAAPKVTAEATSKVAPHTAGDLQIQCLPEGGAYLRARLSGAIDAELSWNDRSLSCAGSVRPDNEGIRLRFAATQGTQRLVLLFGIGGLKEGQSGKVLPANLTIIREGSGEFYGTQGDNKCTIDEITQQPLHGVPLKQRAYRIVARGFCTQPARALNGDGAILVTRFDFSGRADFVSDEDALEATSGAASGASTSSSSTSHSTLPTT